jgi:hypothetical protein
MLGVVSGRRRQGKSFLLEALASATGGLYFPAVEATEMVSLRAFTAALVRQGVSQTCVGGRATSLAHREASPASGQAGEASALRLAPGGLRPDGYELRGGPARSGPYHGEMRAEGEGV